MGLSINPFCSVGGENFDGTNAAPSRTIKFSLKYGVHGNGPSQHWVWPLTGTQTDKPLRVIFSSSIAWGIAFQPLRFNGKSLKHVNSKPGASQKIGFASVALMPDSAVADELKKIQPDMAKNICGIAPRKRQSGAVKNQNTMDEMSGI